MHILVTGAGGFIGRSLVQKARSRGWKVTGVARHRCNEADVIADLRSPIGDWEIPDAVIHLAGGYAGCREREFADNDLPIVRNLLEWGAKNRVHRWVFASAAEVYGDVDGAASESYPCRPVIPYGKSKLQIEGMLQAAGLPEVMICRLGEVYGPGGRILHELGAKLKSGFCPWAGDGKVKISFLHVEDAAEALLLACERAKPGVHIYNAGDDEPATWKQFLDEMAALLSVRGPYYLPKPLAYTYAACSAWMDRTLSRPANVTPQVLRLLITPKILLSMKLRNELGFAPKYRSFYAGLKTAVQASGIK